MVLTELREVAALVGTINRTTREIRALAKKLEDDTDPNQRRPDTT